MIDFTGERRLMDVDVKILIYTRERLCRWTGRLYSDLFASSYYFIYRKCTYDLLEESRDNALERWYSQSPLHSLTRYVQGAQDERTTQ